MGQVASYFPWGHSSGSYLRDDGEPSENDRLLENGIDTEDPERASVKANVQPRGTRGPAQRRTQADRHAPKHGAKQKSSREYQGGHRPRKPSETENSTPGNAGKHSIPNRDKLTFPPEGVATFEKKVAKMTEGFRGAVQRSESSRAKEKRTAEHKVALSEAECSKERTLAEKLTETLSKRRCRALSHDGHFQEMDDDYSRDKLVKRFGLLYDQADIASQKLEELCQREDGREGIEELAPRVFQVTLKAAFQSANNQLAKFPAKLRETVLNSLDEDCDEFQKVEETSAAGKEIVSVGRMSEDIAAHASVLNAQKSGADDQAVEMQPHQIGLEALVKEYLRQKYKGEYPRQVYKETKECVYQSQPFKQLGKLMLVGKDTTSIQASQPATDGFTTEQAGLKPTPWEEIVEKFAVNCTNLAWHFAILPGKIFPRDEDPEKGVEFDPNYHEHHSVSDTTSPHVKEIHWPALILIRHNGDEYCLKKAIVLTQKTV